MTSPLSDRFDLHGMAPAGRPAFGIYLMLPSADVAALLATLAGEGLDFVVVDAQHRPFNPETISRIAHHASAAGLACLVRVPAGGYGFAESVLDYGAAGIVFPVVDSAEDAARCVASCRYPPLGGRSVGGVPGLGPPATDPLCIVQVERATAVDAAAEILAVEGVDAVMPGPADIAASMGMVADYGQIGAAVAASRDLVRTVERAAEEAGIAWFRYCHDPAAIAEAVDDGCRLVHCGNDADLLLGGARRLLEEALHAATTRGQGSR
ncbi:HpcH/HpaI aldolase family protein [Capillimicrobium parvum]|uniref:4-hydroxy-2-oxo-heptane-1,7-dioate aldolase n=1 Tax=Capillimicrobium parvum TaxID=2884022 RepID=A0A9E6XTS3_9ACTN|nr:aldolase/citrate lyase family protein [Capillimicrobium parvum]UGS33682.1 4-hydroxy-2-oxo-heptane-1,7-dioate aldolase [Capillimicrobium parvum]